MTTLTKLQHRLPWTSRLIAHVQSPLFRNGYALVTSAAITSGLGMLYWILAARNYDAGVIGLNTALISTMIFLANFSQLNLNNALNRFIQKAGTGTGKLILSSYAVAVGMALLVGTIFVLGSSVWSPTLYTLFQSNKLTAVWFVIAIMGWVIFVLQDSSMTGLRQATWVPLENLIFSVAKIALLVGFASILTSVGLFASWTFSVIVLLIPINILIFRKLLPKHIQTLRDATTRVSLSEIAKFVSGDYIASVFWTATTDLLPLMVIEMVSPEANAYFYLSWTIAYSLYLVSRNLGMSLITEAALDEQKLYKFSYQVLVQNGRLLLIALLFILPGAPLILSLFGQEYAESGTRLLQLLCLSALPNMVTMLHMSILRVQKRMKALLFWRITLSTSVVGLSYLLLPRIGIIGVGIAWLVGQTIIALILLATDLRPVWLPHLNKSFLFKILAAPRTIFKIIRRRQQAKMVRHVLAETDFSNGAEWKMQQLYSTETDMVVALVENDASLLEKKVPERVHPLERVRAVIKIATTHPAQQSLQTQVNNISMLRGNKQLADFHHLLPTPIEFIQTDQMAYLLEQKVDGVSMDSLLNKEAVQQAAEVILPLHRETAVSTIIDDPLFEQWVTNPFERIQELKGNGRFSNNTLQWLQQELIGLALKTSWIHGDYAPANILMSPTQQTITGIIDWELANINRLPQIDLVLLIITARMQKTGHELGHIIADLYKANQWTSHEHHLLNGSFDALNMPSVPVRVLLILTWLHHINANLTKAVRYQNNPIWIMNNIDPILHLLSSATGTSHDTNQQS